MLRVIKSTRTIPDVPDRDLKAGRIRDRVLDRIHDHDLDRTIHGRQDRLTHEDRRSSVRTVVATVHRDQAADATTTATSTEATGTVIETVTATEIVIDTHAATTPSTLLRQMAATRTVRDEAEAVATALLLQTPETTRQAAVAITRVTVTADARTVEADLRSRLERQASRLPLVCRPLKRIRDQATTLKQIRSSRRRSNRLRPPCPQRPMKCSR